MIPHLCSIHAWVESWNKHFLSSANFPLWGGQMFQLNTKLVVSNQALLWWQSVFSDQGKSVSNNSSFIYEIEYTLNLYQRYIGAGICHLLVKIKPPQPFHKWAQWSYFSSRLQLILIEDIFLTDKDSKNIFILRQYTLNTNLKKKKWLRTLKKIHSQVSFSPQCFNIPWYRTAAHFALVLSTKYNFLVEHLLLFHGVLSGNSESKIQLLLLW